jgi:hypothetical protein
VYFHGKKQEHLFAPLRLCVFARDILVAAVFDPKVSKLALFSGEIGKFFHRKVQN